MHRTLRAVPLVLLAVALGTSAGFAQSPAGSAEASSSRATVQHDGERDQRRQSHFSRSDETSVPSRQELKRMMRPGLSQARSAGSVAGPQLGVDLKRSALEHDVALKGGSLHLAGLPFDSPRPQEAGNSRRIYYIIGGALVAGGLVAGILALSGDGGTDRSGIPRPPGRPAQ